MFKNTTDRLTGFLFPAIFPFIFCVGIYSQTPFTTDDADITDKGKVHFELLNETDLLQRSLHPNLAQNGAIATVDYGLNKNVEVGVDIPLLIIFSAQGTVPRHAFGFSDIGLHIKVKLREEKKESRLPALTLAFSTRFPTGNAAHSLGSGVTNYYLYGIAQKSVTKKVKVRMNAGVLFAGNTVFGVLGLHNASGKLFSGGVSVVKQYTDKLRLGAELTTVVSSSFQLSKGQLQTTLGGGYNLTKKFALDFGLILGRFPASPRVGGLIGFSYDF